MILRDVVLSDEAVSLRASRPARVSALRLAAKMDLYADAAEGDAAPASVLRTEPQTALTSESVCDWLAEQDQATRDDCARILAADIEELRAAARAEGFADGEAAGADEARAGAAAALELLRQCADSAAQTFADETAQLTQLCADVAVQAILKIAGPLLGTREAALGAVLEVIQRIKEERELTIRANAADLDFLKSQEAALTAALGGRRFVLLADPRIAAGGCIVEARLGSLDGRFETQLRECLETLRAAKHPQPVSA